MAVGDVVSGLASVPAYGTLTFQPAPGVEVIIREVGSVSWTGTAPARTPNVLVGLRDAALSTYVREAGSATTWNPLSLGVTNTVYLFIYNAYASTMTLGYAGFQTK